MTHRMANVENEEQAEALMVRHQHQYSNRYKSDTWYQNDPEMQRVQRQLEDENQQEGEMCTFVLDKIVGTCPNLIEVRHIVAGIQ